jgi:hypothetical protein
MDKQTPILKLQVVERISVGPASKVWTPSDFLDLGQRDAVDKTIQRMVASHALRRIGFEYLTVLDAKLDSGIAREY